MGGYCPKCLSPLGKRPIKIAVKLLARAGGGRPPGRGEALEIVAEMPIFKNSAHLRAEGQGFPLFVSYRDGADLTDRLKILLCGLSALCSATLLRALAKRILMSLAITQSPDLIGLSDPRPQLSTASDLVS